MTTTMDIAVCFDCSSSIAFYSNQIRRSILSILRHALLCDESDIRMALIEFQSHTDDWATKIHPFTSSFDAFEQWINDVETRGGSLNECKALVDAFDASLTLDWRPNTDKNRYHEKLLILITDGPPCNFLHDKCPYENGDLWSMSNGFERKDITLVVIGVEPSVVVCDDFYCALAKKTGGEYLPLINASRVLSYVIEQAITGEDTLSQLLHHLNIPNDIELNSLYHYSYVEERVRFMNKYCQTMTDIRKWLYPIRNQSIEYDNNINLNYFAPYSPALMMLHFDSAGLMMSDFDSPRLMIPDFGYFSGNAQIFASTPISDDEGYRTRLPTTASADSSFICISGSPVLSQHTKLFWNGDIDDQSI